MKINKHALCVLFSLVANAAFVQAADTTAVATNAAPPKPRWDTSANIGFTLTRGNSDTMLAAGDISTVRKWGKNEINLGADAVYGVNNGTQNANSVHGFAQYNRLFTERFFGYVRAEALHDEIAAVYYRVSLSPGAGYYLIKTANTSLRAEVGPGYVWERVGTNDNNYATVRFAERFDQKINEHARIWEAVEYLPQVDKFQNYVVNAEIGIETAITKNFTQRASILDTYRSEPAPGKKNNDVKLIVAIGYKF